MAGELPHIKFALTQLHHHLPTIEAGETGPRRAMRYLGDTANQINAEQGRDVLRCLGIDIVAGGTISNDMGGIESPIDLKYLGKGGAIGSGASRLVDFMITLDDLIASSNPTATVTERSAAALTTMNAVRLAQELIGTNDLSWGGYFEGAFWEDERWNRGPSCVHFFLIARELEPDLWTTSLVPRVIAYDPGGETGRLCTLWGEGPTPDQDIGWCEFLLSDHLKGPLTLPTGTDFWTGWRAGGVSVAVLSPMPDGKFHITPFNAAVPSELDVFILEHDQAGWYLPAEVWENASLLAMRVLGRSYQSTLTPGGRPAS